MANYMQTKVVIIWDHEIKAAVKAIQAIKDFNKETTERTEENMKQWSDIVLSAINACAAAKYHPSLLDDDCNVTVMSCNPGWKKDGE